MKRSVLRWAAALSLLAAFSVLLASSPREARSASFVRGDSNADAQHDLSDAIFTLSFLFLGEEQASCSDAADSNDDGALDVSDPLYTLGGLFQGGPEPPSPGLYCGLDPSVDSLDCVAYEPCQFGEGPSEFLTPLDGTPRVLVLEDDVDGTPPESVAREAEEPDRLIEESDIYKLVGENLFVLNRYRGLQVIDLNLDRPTIIGQVPIFGYPREMYVRGDKAYVIVSDYYSYWRDEALIAPQGFYGSQLRIIDISDVRNPQVIGGINLAGEVADSRIVGRVMYLVSNRYPSYDGYATEDTEDKTQIFAVSLNETVEVIDVQDFPRNGWEHHVHVTDETIYLSSSGWVWDSVSGQGEYESRIRYVDISDPGGVIALGGEVDVEGRVGDRWSMDEHEDVLRVASSQSWGNGDVHLTTFSVTNPDRIEQLGQYTLSIDERWTSTRFDGERGYVVTARNVDPLFCFDLSDPARPELLGELVMTGWIDFMVPMGDIIVALGHDVIQRPEGGQDTVLAVSLIEVGDGTPVLLSRVTLGDGWGWVPGDRDEFAKVFRTLPEQGLIMFPFQAWSQADHRYLGGVQLITYDETSLQLRGLIEDASWVQRAIPHDESTVLTLSNTNLQVVTVTNLDKPSVRSKLELARNVGDLDLLAGPYTVQLVGDWYRGDTELIVTHIDDPDGAPISRLHVPSPFGRMFLNGNLVYISSLQDVTSPEGVVTNRVTKVQVVDLEDPFNPRLLGSVTLPEEVRAGYGYWYWGSGDEAVLVGGTTLAFHRFPFYFWFGCRSCEDGVVAAGAGAGLEQEHKIYLVDLADPDQPTLASTVVLDEVDWAWGLKASGTRLFLSFYQSLLEEERLFARYFLHIIDVADPANPLVRPGVNIPGMFVDAQPGTPIIYTHETWWDQALSTTRSFFHALALDGDRAVLQSSVELEGYLNSIQVEGDAAFATTYRSELVVLEDVQRWRSYSTLLSIDLEDPLALRLAGSAKVPQSNAYLQKIDAGRAFLGSSAGIFSYRIDDVDNLEFEAFHRTQGWAQNIVVRDEKAYLPSGYFGVQTLELGDGG